MNFGELRARLFLVSVENTLLFQMMDIDTLDQISGQVVDNEPAMDTFVLMKMRPGV